MAKEISTSVAKHRQVRALQRSLAAPTELVDADFWSFRDAATARHTDEVLFQYPAMMVSPMQGALIDVLREYRDGPMVLLDPFVGSGTTLIEAMRRGHGFVGTDLNPLAVLLARVESAEAAWCDLPASLAAVLRAAANSGPEVRAPTDRFTIRWFRDDVRIELARLQAAIREQPDPRLRRLWWACLAEVCRLCGNARLSTPKLQSRPLEELARPIDVLGRFEQLAERASGVIAGRGEYLQASGFANDGRYLPGVALQLADARDLVVGERLADVVLTSPPYGDNHTTMPYGQASYLPLCWIDLEDAAEGIPEGLLASSRSLDTASLGGSRRTATAEAVGEVAGQSATLASVLEDLQGDSQEAWKRVGSFFIDYANAWDGILGACRHDAHLVLTLGDRTVRGRPVATAAITQELLQARGLEPVQSLHRAIPHHKRIPRRNEAADTIGAETVLVMQRRSN